GGPFDVDPDVDPATVSIGNNRDIASAMSDDGRFVIAWRQGELDNPAATGRAVRARLFDASGQAVAPAFTANSSSAQDPRMSLGAAMDANGDFAISWHNVH